MEVARRPRENKVLLLSARWNEQGFTIFTSEFNTSKHRWEL